MMDTDLKEANDLDRIINDLLGSTDLDERSEQVILELQSILAIYPGSCRLRNPQMEDFIGGNSIAVLQERLRYELDLKLDSFDISNEDTPVIRILVTLEPDYPMTPPQLQLLGKYIGPYVIDYELFGEVIRTFIAQDGPSFCLGQVCVFEGISDVLSRAGRWFKQQRIEDLAKEQERAKIRPAFAVEGQPDIGTPERLDTDASLPVARESRSSGPFANSMISSEPLTLFRSVFIGHSAAVTDPLQVSQYLDSLLQDKKVAKATHPTIYAYRIVRETHSAPLKEPVIIADNFDDGEAGAGRNLAHLLQILGIQNVLVVVSRWYGGTHLGPDRFKMINQAAKDALELAGFLDVSQRHVGSKRQK